MRSFFKELIECLFEFEEALGKVMEGTAGLGFLLLQTKQSEEMTKGGDGVVNGGEIDLLRRSSFWERQLRNGMERSNYFLSVVKLPLQILLGDLEVEHGHMNIGVSQ